MDDLSNQIADIFRRYRVEFRRMVDLPDAECERAVEPFRREVAALVAEHGGEAVVRTALSLSAEPLSLH